MRLAARVLPSVLTSLIALGARVTRVRAGPGHISRLVPGARASLRADRGDVSEPARRNARSTHEPIVTRTIRAARIREERVRVAGVRRQGQGARGYPAEPVSMGRQRSRRDGPHRLQDLRRSRRRHLSRHRRDARAHEHAGNADVGARPRSPQRARDVRAAEGPVVGGRDTALPDRRSLDVYRAEPAVLDGQPHRAERANDSDVQGPRRRRQGIHDQGRDPSRCRRGRSERVRRRCREDRAGAGGRVRRVSGVRARTLHVSR